MNLDIRIPIGLMFGIIGAILAVFGLVSDPKIYDRSLGINVNLSWGCVLVGVQHLHVGDGLSGVQTKGAVPSPSGRGLG